MIHIDIPFKGYKAVCVYDYAGGRRDKGRSLFIRRERDKVDGIFMDSVSTVCLITPVQM